LGLDGEKVFSPEKVTKRKLEETGHPYQEGSRETALWLARKPWRPAVTGLGVSSRQEKKKGQKEKGLSEEGEPGRKKVLKPI
jgi:hypothetical protein